MLNSVCHLRTRCSLSFSLLRCLKILLPLLFSSAFLRHGIMSVLSSLKKPPVSCPPLQPWELLFAKHFWQFPSLPCVTEDSCHSQRSPNWPELQFNSFEYALSSKSLVLKKKKKNDLSPNAFPRLSANLWGKFCSHAYLLILTFSFPRLLSHALVSSPP